MLKTLGRYELIEIAGRGAMGEVYKAWDPSLERLVALKTITSGLADKAELLERFYQEARSAGTLQHPNIVIIYELGKEARPPFIAMEFLDGETVEKIIDRRTVLPLAQKISNMLPVCRALDYAHKRGIVHRDVKPGNVMVSTDGTVKIVDFGIARVLSASHTQTNARVGTLGYMSPQQLKGERADERADIWAFGVMLYELLCYQRPFEGENSGALIWNIINDDKKPTPIRELAPETPADLETLVDRLLQKDIHARLQTMEQVIFELEPILRRLQEATISNLILNGETHLQKGNLPVARETLRRVLLIDSTNFYAKGLLEKVNAEIKRQQLLPQIQSHVDKAHSQLQSASFQEARAEAEAALKLDSAFAPAIEVLAQISNAVERVRQVQDLLRVSKQRVAEGSLTQAALEIDKALEVDPSNPQALETRRQIQEQVARRENRKRATSALQRARIFWTEQRYDECVALLSEAQNDFPDNREIDSVLTAVTQDRAEHQKQNKLADARRLLAAGRLDPALTMIEDLRKQYPEDHAVQTLQALVYRAREETIARKKFEDEIESLRSLINEKRFGEAIVRGATLSREFPDEPDLAELIEFARAEFARDEERRALQAVLQTVRDKMQSELYGEAIAAAESSFGRFSDSSELLDLLSQARKSKREQEARVLLQRARVSLAEQRYDECLALLSDARKRFPDDREIDNLFIAATQDRAEHQKQRKLAEGRSVLAAGNLDSALAVLEDLLRRYPDDQSVQKFQGLLIRAQEEADARKKFQGEMEVLESLIQAKRFSDAANRAEKLAPEFAQEPRFVELLRSARVEVAREAEKQALEALLQEVRDNMRSELYEQAVVTAERALGRFQGHPELSKLLVQARKAKKEKEARAVMQRAKAFLADERYDECIALLSEAERNFPDGRELNSLLTAAKQDLAEHQKQRQLAEARRLLAAGNLEPALGLIQELRKQHPRDSAVQNLHKSVVQAQEAAAFRKKFESEMEALRSLINAKRFHDAVTFAKKLTREFADEPELADLLGFARAEAAREDKKQALEAALQDVRKKIQSGRYGEGIVAAEKALARFREHPELAELLAQSYKLKKEKETNALLEKRISEIRGKMQSGLYTDAADLARQTLTTVGVNPDIGQLLQMADKELSEKRKKKAKQDQQINETRTLIAGDRFEEATKILQDALATSLFSREDSVVQELFDQLQGKKTAQSPSTQSSEPAVRWPAESGEPGRDYVFEIGTRLPSPSLTDFGGRDSAEALFSPGISAPSHRAVPAPAITATTSDALEASLELHPVPPTDGSPRFGALPLWKRPLVIGAIAAVIALTIGVTAFLKKDQSERNRESPSLNFPPAISAAQGYIAQFRWDDAEKALSGMPGSMPEYSQLKSQIDAGRREDSDFNSRKNEIDPSVKANDEGTLRALLAYFNGVANQGGRHSDDARALVPGINRAINLVTRRQPPQPNYLPAISAAQGYIAQFRWDDAEKALSGMPGSMPEYSQLKSQIDAGRREDGDFNSRKNEIDPSVKANDEGTLRALLIYFNGVANQGGRHSDDARGLVPGINRAINDLMARRQPPQPPSPPNYVPAISAAQGYIAQFRWDDAEKALSGMPGSMPEYSQLKSQIDAGRREDSDFNSRKNEIDPSVKANDEGTLRALLAYFNGVANQGGRHSDDARGLVPGINRAINDLMARRQPSQPPSPPSRNDGADIVTALNQYAAAIRDGNMDGVRSARQFRGAGDERKFAESIKAMRGQGYALRNCTPPAITGDTAKVDCDVALLANKDAKPGRTTFLFDRVNSHWLIVATN